jgi:outer membrane immunogenic protein
MRGCLIVAALVLATPAIAADLPAGPVAPVPAGYVPYKNYSWSSVYLGGNVGYGFATASASVDGFEVSSEDLTGIIGGGQIGANYQIGAFVFGVEGDFDASGQSHNTSIPGISLTDKIDWVGTVRGRIGGAYDRWFFYVTAGGGEGKATTNIASPFGSLSISKTRGVWVAGAGVEYGITDYLTARVEYLYLDTGDVNLATIAGFNVTGRVQDNLIRGGLNLRLPF